jgi:hypothetical protein
MNRYVVTSSSRKLFYAAGIALSLLGLSINPQSALAQTSAASAPATNKDALPSYLQNFKPSEEVARQAEGPMRNILNARADTPSAQGQAPTKSVAPKPIVKKVEPAKPAEPLVPAGPDLSNPNEAPSKIYPNDTAYSRKADTGLNELAVTLTNQKTAILDGASSTQKNTNALRIASFGDYMLRGPSQNSFGFPTTPKSRNKLGFNASYINDRAISQNVALFDYRPTENGTQQNPSVVNDHINKFSNSGIQGLLTPVLDYAMSDSGALDDPNRAIANGNHKRHVVSVFPQNDVNGYVFTLDELQGAANTSKGQLAWHPYSDNISFNVNNISNERYEWKIRQKSNLADQSYLSIFMPTVPSSKQQFDGLFFDGEGKDPTSFVGKYILNSYALTPESNQRNVLTMFYPRKEGQALPTMERITATTSDGKTSQAAAFAFANGVTDFVFESATPDVLSKISSPTLDSIGVTAKAKFVVYRKINKNLAFVFVAKGREFKSTGTTNPNKRPVGFMADVEVDIMLRGGFCVITTTKETRLTLQHEGGASTPTARLNGAQVNQPSGGPGWVYFRLPAGTHTIEFKVD